MSDLKGKIFNIQPYSIHDGPGIRTTFFFKGCPLTCKWCQNPESQLMKNQLLVVRDRCVGCGRCVAVCPNGAIEIVDGKAKTDRSKCTVCGACVPLCSDDLREVCGEEYTVEELLKKALADKLFYDGSGGGITASGGEVLMQADFVAEFFAACQAAGLHTTLDTCGFGAWEKLEKIAKHTKLVLYDVKHMDSAIHKELVGVPNELILDNLKKLSKMDVEIYIRIPVIPGMNDSDDNIRKTAEFVKNELGGRYKSFLLPYHRMGESKLNSLEETQGYLDLEPPTQEHMEHLKGFFDALGLDSQIGG